MFCVLLPTNTTPENLPAAAPAAPAAASSAPAASPAVASAAVVAYPALAVVTAAAAAAVVATTAAGGAVFTVEVLDVACEVVLARERLVARFACERFRWV